MTNNDIERLVKSLDKDSIATDTQPKVPSGFQTKPSPKTFPRVRPNPPAAANLDEAKLRRNESGEVIDFHLSGKSNLDRLAITPEVIDAILEHRNLESLSLWGTTTDDKAIERLSDLKKLIAIDLTYTDVTGESLKSLARLPKLVSLRLEGCDVEDSQLAGLSQIPDLMMLYLGKTKVTDDGLTYIRPLKELSLLDLSDCTITDDGLRSLGDLPKLQHLWLSKTIRYGEDDRSELTDECLDYLSSLTTLRELKIADSRLSDRGLADLRKTLPKANIDTERSGVTYIQSKK